VSRARDIVRRVVGVATLIRGIVRLSARNDTPANIEGAFDIADAALRLGWETLPLERLRSDPDAAAMMRGRYGVGLKYDHERLAAAPAGSLGRTLHDNLERGYDPDFYRRPLVDSDWQWASNRGRQIHDVLHIVTGFPPTVVGEIGVFAFLAGNLLDYGCLAIAVTAATTHLLLRPRSLGTDLAVFSRAFLHGAEVRPVLGVRFEDLLERSIFEVREQIGLPRHGLARGRLVSALTKRVPHLRSSSPSLASDIDPEVDPSSSDVSATLYPSAVASAAPMRQTFG
jgi:ubiquinone biosynthesis protein COQ4